MIRIGVSDHKNSIWQGEYTLSELKRFGVEGELVVIKASKDLGNANTKMLEGALSRGEIDVAVHSLQDLSTVQPTGLVITAVSQRDNAADCLLIRREAFAGREIFKLKKEAVVAASGLQRNAQLLDIRPDIQFKQFPGDASDQLEILLSGESDAIFTSISVLHRLNISLPELEIVELNPREFMPAPAQGVIAWQCNVDDLATRRIFKNLHHPEVSACTSVERRVLQILGEACPLGVYCERDAVGNYHSFAACEIDGELRRAQLSSSTNFGVAEKIAQRLQ